MPSQAISTDSVPAAAARVSIALTFFMHGFLTGSWVPHVPIAKEALGVGTGIFGWLLLAMAGGGILAMPLAGGLINRVGSADVARVSGALFCLTFPLPVLAFSAPSFAMGLVIFGAALGTLDVAMNAHGLAVEQKLGRPVMSSFHGWFSVGAAVGAGVGGIITGEFGSIAHAIFVVVGSLAMLVVAMRTLLPASIDMGHSGSHFGWPTPATLGLGALCFLALLVEGAMLDWSALHLARNVGVPLEQAGFGFAAFSTGMAVSRFLGDFLRLRYGSVMLVFSSALAVSLGLGVAILMTVPLIAIVALALAGLGLGNIAPVLFAGGGRAEPSAPGRGIAAVTTMGYSGFLLGPPMIGMAAEWMGLRGALGLTIVAALIVAFSARAARAADG